VTQLTLRALTHVETHVEIYTSVS